MKVAESRTNENHKYQKQRFKGQYKIAGILIESRKLESWKTGKLWKWALIYISNSCPTLFIFLISLIGISRGTITRIKFFKLHCVRGRDRKRGKNGTTRKTGRKPEFIAINYRKLERTSSEADLDRSAEISGDLKRSPAIGHQYITVRAATNQGET